MDNSIDILQAQFALEEDIKELKELGLSEDDISGYIEFFLEAYFPIIESEPKSNQALN
jgi:hypothetical protein